jgi:hypothetical protein
MGEASSSGLDYGDSWGGSGDEYDELAERWMEGRL